METLIISTTKKRIFTAFAVVTALTIGLVSCFYNFELTISELNAAGIAIFMIGLAIFSKIECHGRVSAFFHILLLLLLVSFSYTIFEIFQSGPFNSEPIIIFLNFGCIAIPVILMYALIGRPRLALILSSVFLFIFGLGGYFIHRFRGDMLLYSDLKSTKTALQVSSGYHFEITGTILVGTVIFVAMILWMLKAKPKIANIKKSGHLRLGALTVAFLGVFLFIQTDAEQFYRSWEQEIPLNGYAYAFCANMKMMNVQPPEHYSTEKMGDYMEGKEATVVGDRGHAEKTEEKKVEKKVEKPKKEITVKPNIIAIMNESFSDPKVIGDFETNIPYRPFLDGLTENTIKGNVYVSVFGGGTCDSEYSFLTGNTTAFLPLNARPYQLYIDSPTPGLPMTLKDQGYKNSAIHPGEPMAWNRQMVYPELGFDEFLAADRFNHEKMIHGYISDEATYDKIIDLYKNKKDKKDENPLFIFDVTIQNHGGYSGDTTGLEHVTLKNMKNKYPGAEQYLSLMRNSDEAFEKLITYFQDEEEPTLIIMFGDHQAGVEPGFQEELMGKPMAEWTLEERQQRYVTPFVIWANYDIPEKTIDKISINYLESLLLDQTGLEQTSYNKYLSRLSETLPVININGIIDRDGTYFHKGEPSPYTEELRKYRRILYNNIFDKDHRRDDLFRIQKK
ncbi:MAG: LTA synthase family protein [Eubacterium sp.]